MRLDDFLKKDRAVPLPLSIDGEKIEGVYFRNLTAGEGLQLKTAAASLMDFAGDVKVKPGEDDESLAKRISPDQLRALLAYQAVFTYLHFSNSDGSRKYDCRDRFDAECPDELVSAFYEAGSKHKSKEGDTSVKEAEKNS